MAKRPPTPPAEPAADALVQLRLHDRTRTDWAFACEGFLLLYDPAVVTDAVWEELHGFQNLAPAALGWMAGQIPGGRTFAPVGEVTVQPPRERAATARRLGRLVQLGWEGALASLPLVVNLNGADVRFTTTGLTAGEKIIQQAKGRQQKGLTTLVYPRTALITARGPRLGVTWDWMLGFTPRERRKNFGPGCQVEFPWPAGDYQARAWQFEALENETTGECIERFVIHLVPVPQGGVTGAAGPGGGRPPVARRRAVSGPRPRWRGPARR